MRPSRSGRVCHREVLDGIHALLSERGSGPGPRVSIYTVVMRDRPRRSPTSPTSPPTPASTTTSRSLSPCPDYKLFAERCHTLEDIAAVEDQLRRLQ
ncbi:hypothetical protein ACFVTP_37290 [Streptomyces celluloflavus]|uniref:hypothetical protein n=1 Tax=Streptomyces celluloflavus TaxID=58344 RepID=UPI0036DA8FA9